MFAHTTHTQACPSGSTKMDRYRPRPSIWPKRASMFSNRHRKPNSNPHNPLVTHRYIWACTATSLRGLYMTCRNSHSTTASMLMLPGNLSTTFCMTGRENLKNNSRVWRPSIRGTRSFMMLWLGACGRWPTVSTCRGDVEPPNRSCILSYRPMIRCCHRIQ